MLSLKENSKRSNFLYFIFVILISSLCTLPWIFNKGFYSEGEPREAMVAQAMLATQNYILPQRYDDQIATKPPAFHWLIVLAAKAFGGLSEATSRLPSVLTSILCVVVFALFLARNLNARMGILSVVLLLGCIEWHRYSVNCRVDMSLSTFLVIGLLGLYNWEQSKLAKISIIAVFFLSLATLTKGPVAIALPALIFSAYLFSSSYPIKEIVLANLKIFVPVLLISSIWYLLAYLKAGDQFIDVFLSENLGRFTGTMQKGRDPHEHSGFYLLGTLILGLLPWIVPILVVACSKIGRIAQVKFFRTATYLNFWSWFKSQSALNRYFIISIISFIVFYWIPSSKRSVYLLPIYPFCCYFLAMAYASISGSSLRIARRASIAMVIFFVALLATVLLFRASVPFDSFLKGRSLIDFKFYSQVLDNLLYSSNFFYLLLIYTPIILGSLAIATYFSKTYSKHFMPLAVIAYFVLQLVLEGPILSNFTSELSPKKFVESVEQIVPGGANIYSYSRDYPTNYYFKNRLKTGTPVDIDDQESYIIVASSQLETFLHIAEGKFEVQKVVESTNPVRKPSEYLSLYKLARKF